MSANSVGVAGSAYDKVVHALTAKGDEGRNGNWKCPAHDDDHPSLTVDQRGDKVLLCCHAGDGCKTEDIIEALGLTMADLFDQPLQRAGSGEWDVAAVYDYLDETGRELLHQTVRTAGKHFYQRHPAAETEAAAARDTGVRDKIKWKPAKTEAERVQAPYGWIQSTQGRRLVLYRLAEVVTAVKEGRTVYICEGEKDCDAVAVAGATATCNPMGAGKWRDEYTESLAGAADIVIIADRDTPGRDHARNVADNLKDHVGRLRIAEAVTGKDAADHLGAGHTLDQLAATWDSTPTLDPDVDEFICQGDSEYDWAIPELLEREDRVILTGGEGCGKSTLTRQIGYQVASGIHPFTGQPMPALNVLLIDLENGERHVRRKLSVLRPVAAGLDPQRLRIIIRGDGINLLDPEDQAWLEERIAADKPDLVLIGPLYKLAGGDPTEEKVARTVAGCLDRLRTAYHFALVMEAHSGHGSDGKRPERPYGASLWMRWPEFGLHLGTDGGLRHWRGQRDERAWPTQLIRSTPWPWAAAAATSTEPKAVWDGPTQCMNAIEHLLRQHPNSTYSKRQLAGALRASGQSYRDTTVGEAAERLAADKRIQDQPGPRNSQLFSAKPETKEGQNDRIF